MTDLPAPLTPPDCDLRGFEWMAIHGHRLFTSGWYLAAMKDPRGGIAALKLWWAAMLQCPAGSLPSDEEELCLLADFGQDMRAWRKHRVVAMRGFVLCQDGRYYHPVVAEQALKAYEGRLKASATRAGDAERLRRWRASRNGSHPPEKPNGQGPPETRFKPVSQPVSEPLRNGGGNANETRQRVQSESEGEGEKKEKKVFNLTFLSEAAREAEAPSEAAVLASRRSAAAEIAAAPGGVGAAIQQLGRDLRHVEYAPGAYQPVKPPVYQAAAELQLRPKPEPKYLNQKLLDAMPHRRAARGVP